MDWPIRSTGIAKMRWNDLSTHPCPVARTMSAIGDRWTILILRDALRGATRFDDFHARLQCSRAIIAERLAHLVEEGMLVRELYGNTPPRHDYRLTDKGRAIGPVMMTMAQWGETWMPAEGGYRVKRVHKTCGCAFQPRLSCSECGEVLKPGDVEHMDPVRKAGPA